MLTTTKFHLDLNMFVTEVQNLAPARLDDACVRAVNAFGDERLFLTIYFLPNERAPLRVEVTTSVLADPQCTAKTIFSLIDWTWLLSERLVRKWNGIKEEKPTTTETEPTRKPHARFPGSDSLDLPFGSP